MGRQAWIALLKREHGKARGEAVGMIALLKILDSSLPEDNCFSVEQNPRRDTRHRILLPS